MLSLCYAFKTPHKLKLSHHRGRAHGFQVRASPTARQKQKFAFSNILTYQSERTCGEKSNVQAYKTHEASFSNFAKYRVNFTVSKTFFQITAVDEFDVIKK